MPLYFLLEGTRKKYCMKSLEKQIYQHLRARKWDNLRPADIAKSIMIEGAELLELFQWENLSLEEVKKINKKWRISKKNWRMSLSMDLRWLCCLDWTPKRLLRRNLLVLPRNIPPNLCGRERMNRELKASTGKSKGNFAKTPLNLSEIHQALDSTSAFNFCPTQCVRYRLAAQSRISARQIYHRGADSVCAPSGFLSP